MGPDCSEQPTKTSQGGAEKEAALARAMWLAARFSGVPDATESERKTRAKVLARP